MSNGKTFKEAYGTLQRHAQTLRSQQEPDIDNLTTIVTESVEAYKVCKERIDAVEAALKAALDGAGVGVPPQAAPVKSSPPASPSPSTEVQDDDIPF